MDMPETIERAPVNRTARAPSLPEIEETVRNIWSAILCKNTVDAHDDFFDLGGTSLGLISVVSRMRESFGIPIDTSIVLKGASIAALSQEVLNEFAGRKTIGGAP